MYRLIGRPSFMLCALLLINQPSASASTLRSHPLSLAAAEQYAVTNNPTAASIRAQSQAYKAEGEYQAQLPNPQMQLGVANLPVDSFDFNQENMSQFKVGLSQQIPGGNSRAIRQNISDFKAQSLQFSATDNELKRLKTVRQSWLELHYLQKSQQLILEHQKIVQQLLTVVKSSYQVGKSNQHDLLMAELQLNKLDSDVLSINEKVAIERSKLSRWIGSYAWQPLSDKLPDWRHYAQKNQSFSLPQTAIHPSLLLHPQVIQQNKQLQASRLGVNLAKEAYKPNWGVNLGYGYRDDTPAGEDRADFFSASITVEIPWFNSKRQDKKISQNLYQQKALQNNRLDTIQKLQAELTALVMRNEQLEKKHQLYKNIINKKASEQTQAALSSYQNGKSDFSSVVLASAESIDAKRQLHRIIIDQLKTIAAIYYLLPQSSALNHKDFQP